ncbi:hypothetical protein HMPREF9103_03094 [Lentilactobacillus parafarraginis F0439]|uniref:Uncharacterized protein n=1 Tax=Lentilactobacillus parafarraginis F0439 TaxID=797515 RepID=G9ZTK9_9LACO|nr:hypothetical protein HMPREF9103_03094 [Lentilactobacillus parafarraginis F0439]
MKRVHWKTAKNIPIVIIVIKDPTEIDPLIFLSDMGEIPNFILEYLPYNWD